MSDNGNGKDRVISLIEKSIDSGVEVKHLIDRASKNPIIISLQEVRERKQMVILTQEEEEKNDMMFILLGWLAHGLRETALQRGKEFGKRFTEEHHRKLTDEDMTEEQVRDMTADLVRIVSDRFENFMGEFKERFFGEPKPTLEG